MPVWLQILAACVNAFIIPAVCVLGWLLKQFAEVNTKITAIEVDLAALRQNDVRQDQTCRERLEWLRTQETMGRATHDAVVKIAAKLDIDLGK